MTLAEIEAAERDAFSAIGALGERELASVKAWIASGCEGPQPRPDVEARRVLADRLSAAVEPREVRERVPAAGTANFPGCVPQVTAPAIGRC